MMITTWRILWIAAGVPSASRFAGEARASWRCPGTSADTNNNPSSRAAANPDNTSRFKAGAAYAASFRRT